ncbi:hypothetical protein BN946_scf184990.g10 [Trametes cinnabarina]|uniref:Uncharacterized protein n=1 Tax=Pycnoporus cinnabarinus TaxID=5643 RepID=A0A060SE13_PYCCI|nr:hypothetical protein BN946_scf184990.g10 [Trametes cinnabarina]
MQAVKIDASYAKAWARLAAASAGLGKRQETVDAWQRALAVLPVEKLTPAQQKQRDLYSTKLSEAKAKAAERAQGYTPPHITLSVRDEDKPWNRAAKVVQELLPSNTWNSSTIVSAFKNWSSGLEMMNQLRIIQTSAGPGCFGHMGVIERLSNAVIEDSRAFVLMDQDFFSKYNQKGEDECSLLPNVLPDDSSIHTEVVVEVSQSRAWKDGGAKTVMEEAPKRVQREGWDTTRFALAVTVRGWLLRAFMQENVMHDIGAALDFYTSAIEVIQWGMQRWRDVPINEKGSIFQASFLRGVKCLRLDACIKAYTEHRGPSSKMPLSQILAGANELLDELSAAPGEPDEETGIPYFMCFTRYPLAHAHSLRGFYHQHIARNARQAGSPALEVSESFQAAAAAYMQAADIFPQDDEKHVMHLHFAVDALMEAGSPASQILGLLDRIRDGIPIVKRIWEFSADAVSGCDAMLYRDMSLRKRLVQRMQDGQIAADGIICTLEHRRLHD